MRYRLTFYGNFACGSIALTPVEEVDEAKVRALTRAAALTFGVNKHSIALFSAQHGGSLLDIHSRQIDELMRGSVLDASLLFSTERIFDKREKVVDLFGPTPSSHVVYVIVVISVRELVCSLVEAPRPEFSVIVDILAGVEAVREAAIKAAHASKPDLLVLFLAKENSGKWIDRAWEERLSVLDNLDNLYPFYLAKVKWGYLDGLCYEDSYVQECAPIEDSVVFGTMDSLLEMPEVLRDALDIMRDELHGQFQQKRLLLSLLRRTLFVAGSQMEVHPNFRLTKKFGILNIAGDVDFVLCNESICIMQPKEEESSADHDGDDDDDTRRNTNEPAMTVALAQAVVATEVFNTQLAKCAAGIVSNYCEWIFIQVEYDTEKKMMRVLTDRDHITSPVDTPPQLEDLARERLHAHCQTKLGRRHRQLLRCIAVAVIVCAVTDVTQLAVSHLNNCYLLLFMLSRGMKFAACCGFMCFSRQSRLRKWRGK
ncbi:unnamed protein product [Phytophthora lilii]|uniref:Unnamed protein product n=1 Tax=Phytophthora lilii TaxID=2077276 RepID=A0A9W6WQW3_9STRA|nr:unnamed protein product [Phytophthora lilii]